MKFFEKFIILQIVLQILKNEKWGTKDNEKILRNYHFNINFFNDICGM